MTCPYLKYRRGDGDRQFAGERAYCTVVDDFVSPMRADVCNDRYGFEHGEHCEIYAEFEDGSE